MPTSISRFSRPLVRKMTAVGTSLLCLTLVCSLPGCGGGKGDEKKSATVPASGKVEFDGKPIPAGTVTFISVATGNMATCTISNGSYSCASSAGPNPGDNAVTIMGKETADGNPMWGRAWTKQVKVGDKEFKEDFSIKANEVKPFDPKSLEVDN